MSSLSDFAGGSFPLVAGAPGVSFMDLIEMGPDGKAYTVKTSDYAAAATLGTSLVAATTITNNAEQNGDISWQNPVLVGADGSLYFVSPAGSSQTGLVISRYNPAALLLGTVTLNAGVPSNFPSLAFLSNGNIVVVWFSSGSAYYAIYTPLLAQVAPMTSIGSAASSYSFGKVSLLALSGGGFMVTYPGSGNVYNVAVFSSAGAVVTAPTALSGATSTTFAAYLAQLSNGNVALTLYNSQTGNWKTVVLTNTGSVAVALFTSPNSGSSSPGFGGISALPSGYFAIVYSYYTSVYAFGVSVYSNAGVLQGSSYVGTTTSTYASTVNLILTNDGTQFILVYPSGADNTIHMMKFQTTGTYTDQSMTGMNPAYIFGATGGQWGAVDSAGFMVIMGGSAAVANYWATIDTVRNAGSAISSISGAQNTGGLAFAGDFSVIFALQNASAYGVFQGVKYQNSSIQGVALNSAAGGAYVSVQPNRIGGGASSYGINYVRGTQNKSFNHNSTTSPNVIGNKGVISSYGVNLLGIA